MTPGGESGREYRKRKGWREEKERGRARRERKGKVGDEDVHLNKIYHYLFQKLAFMGSVPWTCRTPPSQRLHKIAL